MKYLVYRNCVNSYFVLYSSCALSILSLSYVLYKLRYCVDYTLLEINHIRDILRSFVWMVKVKHEIVKNKNKQKRGKQKGLVSFWLDFGCHGK